jgi:hypothetical protein
MRLPLVLGLAAALSIASCQENKTTTESVKVQKTSNELSKDEFLVAIDQLSKKVEKALTVEVDNTKKAKRILTFVKESRLTNVQCKKAVMKVMDKMTLPIDEQKEVMYILDAEMPN